MPLRPDARSHELLPVTEGSTAIEALKIAAEARAIIVAHQETCDRDRLQRSIDMMDLKKALTDFQSEMRRAITKSMSGSILILLGVIGYFLATNGLPGAPHP